MWHRQGHLFGYYIEYGIAQLGALQMWLNREERRTR
jgi:oligoendopeptidase F